MAVVISNISPPRVREGDVVTINGSGFSTTPSDNLVLFDQEGVTPSSATATQLVCTVPPIDNRDGYIRVVVALDDGSGDQDTHWLWAKPTLVEMQTESIPGQVPGPGEDVDVAQADVAEAKDYERAATLAEYLAREVLAHKGDIPARDSTGIKRFGMGGPGTSLAAEPGADEGLVYSRVEKTLTLLYGRIFASAFQGHLVANGDGNQTDTAPGEMGLHAVPFNGIIDSICVLHETAGGAATITAVQVQNGVTLGVLHTSGAISLAAGQSYRVTGLSIAVRKGHKLWLTCTRTGGSGDSRVFGSIRLVERMADLRDQVHAVDTVARSTAFERTIADTAVVSDGVTVELNGVDVDYVDPLTIFGAKVEAWYRPDAGHVSVDAFDVVTQLDDRSGNGHHLNAINGSPTLTSDGGVPCIDFESDNNDEIYRAAAALTGEPIVFIAVADMETVGGTLMGLTSEVSSDYHWLTIGSGDAARVQTRADSTTAVGASHGDALVAGTRYVLYGEFAAPDDRTVNVNGGTPVQSTQTRNATGLTKTVISNYTFTDGWDGRVFEALILNAVPTAGEMSAYHAYTADRFGAP